MRPSDLVFRDWVGDEAKGPAWRGGNAWKGLWPLDSSSSLFAGCDKEVCLLLRLMFCAVARWLV